MKHGFGVLVSLLSILVCEAVYRGYQDVIPEDLDIDQIAYYIRTLDHQPREHQENDQIHYQLARNSPNRQEPQIPVRNSFSRQGAEFHIQNSDNRQHLEFPELTPEQRQFAVNPSFPQYFDHSSGHLRVDPDTEPSRIYNGKKRAETPEHEKRADINDISVAQQVSGAESSREPGVDAHVEKERDASSDLFFTAIVSGCSAAAVAGIVAAGICWYKLHQKSKAAADVEYPAYGVTGPNKELSPSSGDRKLAQSAQMYHYQHQKQQMIAMEKTGQERHGSASDVESEDENEEGDYTVYECPGLAPTGEMEVKNPLFKDEVASANGQTKKEEPEK